jgi:phosphatidate cytidylyltransferase
VKGDIMDKRVVSALIAIPVLLFFVVSGGVIFKVGVVSLSVIALYEYINVYSKNDDKPISWVLYIGFLLHYLVIALNMHNLVLPTIYLIVFLSMSVPIFNRSYSVISSSLTVTGFLYIINFFSLLILIRDFPNGNYFIWLVFLISFFCDTFAYYTGRFLGRNKLCPLVSPKKTVEGALGGVVGSIVGVTIWKLIVGSLGFTWIHIISLGIIGAVISQIGDLSASLIKRYVGVKDYGNIMPGHGGVLDRFDSILFTAPVVYYYIIFFIG